jgi:hypothetical protein
MQTYARPPKQDTAQSGVLFQGICRNPGKGTETPIATSGWVMQTDFNQKHVKKSIITTMCSWRLWQVYHHSTLSEVQISPVLNRLISAWKELAQPAFLEH